MNNKLSLSLMLSAFILVVFLFTSCSDDDVLFTSTTIELPLGERVSVEGTELNLTYDRLEEDSRCPYLALCIWEGRAWVKLKNEGDTTDYDLITESSANKDTFLTTQIGGHNITLLDVFPDVSIQNSRTDSVVVVQVDPK